MAVTKIVDTVPVKSFTALVEAKLAENSKFRLSGLVGTDPRVTAKAQVAGLETQLREWKRPAGGEATSASDDETSKLVAGKVEQVSMTARVIQRSKSFSAMDIADYVSDADAIQYAAGEFARLRVADEESALLATLSGVLADNLANDFGDMIKNLSIITGTIAAANKFGSTTLAQARTSLGDAAGQCKIMVAHSDVVNNLRALEPNAFVPASQTNIGLETYQGNIVVETDNMGINTGTANYPIYTTYFAGPQLFAYASCPIENALVQYRDEAAGDGSGMETILNRFRYLLPILGFTNKVAPTNGVSQTNAQLATAATWDRVSARKTIPLIAIRTNG